MQGYIFQDIFPLQITGFNCFDLGTQTGWDENNKICKELENIKAEVVNVKVEVEGVSFQLHDFNNQVSSNMSRLDEALQKIDDFKNQVSADKALDPSLCIGCSMGAGCLDGKPVGDNPLDRAMVTKTADLFGSVAAGDTGVGYYTPRTNVSYGSYNIIWKNAGPKEFHGAHECVVYKCDGKH